jgi:hypothetical protein
VIREARMAVPKRPTKTTSTKGLLAPIKAQQKRPKLAALRAIPKLAKGQRQPVSTLTPAHQARQAALRKQVRAFFGL